MAKKEQPVTDKSETNNASEESSTSGDSALENGGAAPNRATQNSDTSEKSDMDVLNELRDAYEQARIDLKQTTDKLRVEIQKIDMEEASEKAKTWVKDNPGLSFFLAIGAGMIVGRALTKAVEPPPPPSLMDRARSRSNYLADNARHYAEDAAGRLSAQATAAGEQLADRVRAARGSIYDHAGSLGDEFNKRASALGESATEKAGELIGTFSDAAERAADSLQVAARDLAKSVKKQKKSPQNLYETLLNSAKTVFGAFVFKRLSDWLRERY